jgi:hypothetical protein
VGVKLLLFYFEEEAVGAVLKSPPVDLPVPANETLPATRAATIMRVVSAFFMILSFRYIVFVLQNFLITQG